MTLLTVPPTFTETLKYTGSDEIIVSLTLSTVYVQTLNALARLPSPPVTLETLGFSSKFILFPQVKISPLLWETGFRDGV